MPDVREISPGVAPRSPVAPTEWPSVGVVITTRDRPNLVRRALRSVLSQDYPGPMRVVVVVDRAAPDWSLAGSGARPVLVLENWRTPGADGARNTGVLAAGDCEWVALCDDDDTWAAGKLSTQMSAALRDPGSVFGTCAAEVEYDGRRIARRLGIGPVTLDAVSRGRARGLIPSGFVARHDVLVRPPHRGGIGLFAEEGPTDGATWDLLMRAARLAPIVHVDEPYVRVLWRRPAANADDALVVLRWMTDRHPELRTPGRPAARHLAEIACWEAVSGHRSRGLAYAHAALRFGRTEPLTLLAIAAALGLARGRGLVSLLRRHQLVP
jgi:glycosyltransferase involved in cell wall biosynthesis